MNDYERRTALMADAKIILDRALLLGRDLNDEEQRTLAAIERDIDRLDRAVAADSIKDRVRPVLDSQRSITASASGDINDQYFARDLFRDAVERRDLAGDTGGGANLVGTEYSSALWDALRAQSVAFNIPGIRVVDTDDASIVVPRMSADAAADWQSGQGGSYAASEPTFVKYTLTPKTVGVVGTFSNQLLEDSIVGQRAILDAMVKAVAVKMDSGLLAGAGTGGAPLGISGIVGATSVSGGAAYPVDLSEMAAGIADLEAAYAKPTCFITTANVWANGYLPIKRGGTSDLTPLFSDFASGATGAPVAKAFGLPILVGQAPAGYLLTVAGGELVIAKRQGISVLIDPFTNAHTGETRVVVTARVDIAGHADSVHITTAMQP